MKDISSESILSRLEFCFGAAFRDTRQPGTHSARLRALIRWNEPYHFADHLAFLPGCCTSAYGLAHGSSCVEVCKRLSLPYTKRWFHNVAVYISKRVSSGVWGKWLERKKVDTTERDVEWESVAIVAAVKLRVYIPATFQRQTGSLVDGLTWSSGLERSS